MYLKSFTFSGFEHKNDKSVYAQVSVASVFKGPGRQGSIGAERRGEGSRTVCDQREESAPTRAETLPLGRILPR